MIGRAYNAMFDMERTNQDTGYTANAAGNGRCGRPSFEISTEQFLLSKVLKSDISAMLGVSVRTVERRMLLFGLVDQVKLMKQKSLNFSPLFIMTIFSIKKGKICNTWCYIL